MGSNPTSDIFPLSFHTVTVINKVKLDISENVRMVDHERSKVLRLGRSRFHPA